MRRKDQDGIYGEHEDLDQVVQIIKDKPRGATFQELKQETEFHKNKLRTILAQADALGMIVAEGVGNGRQGRFFPTDNKQLHIPPEISTEEAIEKMKETVKQLEKTEDESLRLSIQKV